MNMTMDLKRQVVHPPGPWSYVVFVALSLVLHVAGAILAGVVGSSVAQKEPSVTSVRVAIARPAEAPPPVVVPTPAPVEPPPILRDPPKVKPEKSRQARARERNVPPAPEPVNEVRGGLSESFATSPSPSENALAVAQGNSSEVAVDPSKGDEPPPVPAALGSNPDRVDYSAVAVEEAFADVSASCSGALPQLELTEDAINAGLSKGRLVFDVIIDDTGRVREPKLIKGTGYEIDRIARAALEKIVCVPAQVEGKKAVVRKEIVFEVVDF